jgi:hypothetical protein
MKEMTSLRFQEGLWQLALRLTFFFFLCQFTFLRFRLWLLSCAYGNLRILYGLWHFFGGNLFSIFKKSLHRILRTRHRCLCSSLSVLRSRESILWNESTSLPGLEAGVSIVRASSVQASAMRRLGLGYATISNLFPLPRAFWRCLPIWEQAG